MRRHLIRTLRAALAGALALGLLAAGAGQAGSAAAGSEPLRQQVQLGPVRVTLEADRRTMPIDGQLHLSLTVEAPAGTAVTPPATADKLGPFVIASQSAQAPSGASSDPGQWRQDYVLEAEDVGAQTVPPLTVRFREPAAGETRQLATAPVAITVSSLLPADVDFTAYKDIAPPVELPPAPLSWLVWPAALLTLGLAGLALLVWRRRRRQTAAPLAAQPAHLLALAELERLERRLPADRPGTEEFYVRLADILRHYMALRFGLSAPAQTTEELLAAVDDDRRPDRRPPASDRPNPGPLRPCQVRPRAASTRHRPWQPAPGARDFVEQTAGPQ